MQLRSATRGRAPALTLPPAAPERRGRRRGRRGQGRGRSAPPRVSGEQAQPDALRPAAEPAAVLAPSLEEQYNKALEKIRVQEEQIEELREMVELKRDHPRREVVVPLELVEPIRQAFFGTQFFGDDVLDELWNDLESSYRKWLSQDTRLWTKYLSPYTALVQSSGWGKSRLVYELHRKNVFVVYCSAMHRTSRGFPGRSEALADQLQIRHLTHERVAAYIICSLRVLREEVESYMSPGTSADGHSSPPTMAKWWIDQLMDSRKRSPIPDKIVAEMTNCEAALVAATSALQQVETSDMALQHHQREAQLAVLWSAIRKEVDSLRGAMKGGQDQVPMADWVVFCWDEAAQTKLANGDSCFGVIRRVLSACKYGVFGLMVGSFACMPTNSTLTQLCPPHSTMKIIRLAYDVLPPAWLVGAGDGGKDPNEVDAGAVEAMPRLEAGEMIAVEDFFRLGRPLWGAMLQNGCTAAQLLDFASRKLKGGLEDKACTMDFAVGMLGCSIGLDVTSWSETAEQAVAYHMMTAIWISEDRRQVEITSAAEPVLSSAAAKYFKDEGRLLEVLNRLADLCKDGIVKGGPRGEIVVRLLLLLAMYKALERKGSLYYVDHVSVKDYLSVLFGEVPEGLGARVDLDANLFFNAFSPSSADPNGAGLMQSFMARCRALQCRPRESAMDGSLPLVSRGTKKAKGASGPPPPVFSSIDYRCQAKTDSPEKISKAVSKMEKLGASVDLVMQVGSSKDQVSVQGKAIVALGLSRTMFPFLSEPILAALKKVAKVSMRGPLDKYEDPRKERIVKCIVPLSFEEDLTLK